MSFKSILCACIFAVAPMAYAMEEQDSVEVVQVEQEIAPAAPKVSNLTYFATHLATGALAYGANLAFTEALDKRPDDKVAGFIIAWCAICVAWKIPQWTDRLMGIKRERDFANNLTSFFIRTFVPYPLGTLTSELCIQNHHD